MTLSRQGADVRINEVNLSASLVQNSNATAALVVVSKQGPIGPRYYSSYERFKEDFGQPDASVSFDHYMAKDYFQEGNSLWATRAVNTDATVALMVTAGQTTTPAGPLPPNALYVAGATTTQDPTTVDPVVAAPSLPSTDFLYGFYPTLGPGGYSANLAVEIVSENLDAPASVTVTIHDAVGGSRPNATVTLYRVAAVNAAGQEYPYTEAGVTTTVINQRINVAWLPVAGAVAYRIYGNTAASMGYLTTVGAGTLSYIDDGFTVPDATSAAVANVSADYRVILPANLSNKFQVRVYRTDISTLTPRESFNVTMTDAIDEMGQATEITQRINNFSKYIRVVSYLPLLLAIPPVRHLPRTNFVAASSGSAPTSTHITTAWNRFKDKQRYVVDVLVGAGRTTSVLQKAQDTLAQQRSDCVSFIEVPPGKQAAQDAIDFRNVDLNLNSSYSALFCSDLYESDEDTGKLMYVPPSGAMAGLLARTTRVGQPWFSIAGLNRGLLNVLDVRNVYDDGESTLLANAQVNYMRKFLGQGIPLWEQFTLSSQASSLQFLNVRVLCNIIKRTMYSYLLYALQEQDDDILRRQVKYGLEEYLRYVQGARGIKSFTVVCNSTNNTAQLVNSATLAVSVYIVPLLAVRQVNLTLVIGKEGLTISETDIANLSV